MDLISVVVPVYKVEKYLNRCINSLTNQTYKNLEIILVDDGSPDNCGKMCDEWVTKDSRIKVIHKENAGLGYARNSGIDVAGGKYIMFVDSDDYIMENACELAYRGICDNGVQICSFGCIDDYNGKQFIRNKDIEMKEYVEGDVIDLFLANALAQDEESSKIPFVMMSAWSAIYDLSVIKDNNIRFMSERDCVNEDLFFRADFCKCIHKAIVIPEYLYCYCHNGTSLTTSYRSDRFEGSLRMYDILIKSLNDYMNRADISNRCKRAFMNNIIVCLKQEVVYCKQKGVRNLIKKYLQIVNNDVVCNVLASYPIDKLPIQQKFLYKFIKNKQITLIIALVNFNLLIKKMKQNIKRDI